AREPRRSHTDHLVWPVEDQHFAADDRRASGELALTDRIAENNTRIGTARPIVIGAEKPADCGAELQGGKEFSADRETQNVARASALAESRALGAPAEH